MARCAHPAPNHPDPMAGMAKGGATATEMTDHLATPCCPAMALTCKPHTMLQQKVVLSPMTFNPAPTPIWARKVVSMHLVTRTKTVACVNLIRPAPVWI